MAEESDPQMLKRAAAATYDYESDPRWGEYWSNVLIPPHMSSRSDVVDYYRRKFYHRYIDPSYVVQPLSSSSSSQASGASERSSSIPATKNERPRNLGSSSATSATPATQGRTSTSLKMDRWTIQFAVNAWVFSMSILGILPLVPSTLSNKVYRLSLLGTTVSSLFSLYTRFGIPSSWNQPAIHTWLQSVFATEEFIRLPYSLMFLTSQLPFKFALVPVLCWSLEHVAKFLRRNLAHSTLYRRYLDGPCLWVEVNKATLSILSSNVEVALGFLLIISLFSHERSIIHTFIYWQLLKLMYHVPATAGYHRSIWSKIDHTTSPYIHQYAPFLDTPISAIKRWWSR